MKCKKYQDIKSHDFVPVAVETTAVLGPQARSLLQELGRRLIVKAGDLRESAFLRQRLDIAICRGNALAIKGSYDDKMSHDMFLSVVQSLDLPSLGQ